MKEYTPEDVEVAANRMITADGNAAKAIADLINAAVKEAVEAEQEYIAALEDFENSVCGQPKLCGHEFTCVCPSDRLKAIRARGVKEG